MLMYQKDECGKAPGAEPTPIEVAYRGLRDYIDGMDAMGVWRAYAKTQIAAVADQMRQAAIFDAQRQLACDAEMDDTLAAERRCDALASRLLAAEQRGDALASRLFATRVLCALIAVVAIAGWLL